MKNNKRSQAATAIFLATSLVMLFGLNFLAFSPATSIRRVEMKNDLSTAYMNNEVNEFLSKVVGIEPIRSLPYDFSTPLTKPDQANFFSDGGKQCYKDSTIEVTCWKERHPNGSEIAFADIQIKHPSQFRRQWSYGDYNSKKNQYPINIFAGSNGVIGMSADFYKHRKYGVIVQYGTVICDKRCDKHKLDVLVVDYNGDFHIWDDTELSNHIARNGADDIMLSFTFGPALITDGVKFDPSTDQWYDLGIPDQICGRAAIGQLGKLHYLLCTVGNPGIFRPMMADILADKGCVTAYNLDGGQSGTILFRDEVFNKIAYVGKQRDMSDILYFASAE